MQGGLMMEAKKEIPNLTLLKVTEVADKLKVSKRSVYRYINRGLLPSVRLGTKTIRVSTEDLATFVLKYRRE